MTIAQRLEVIRTTVAQAAREVGRDPQEITLVAATKTQPPQVIREAVEAGVTVCGENRVQELVAHLEEGCYPPAQVHFIGHLQTNKVKYVVGKVDLIHSVSSLRLLDAIQRQAEKVGVVQEILLEVNVANEASKEGFALEDTWAAAHRCQELSHVHLRGLMCIPPVAQDPGGNISHFRKLASLAVDIAGEMGDNGRTMGILSMGMSRDYPSAIAAGATHIRIGTQLFGPRPTPPKL